MAAVSRLIDVHVHVFPTPEQGRSYQRNTPNPPRNGDLAELLRLMDEAGVDQAVLLMYLPSLDMYEAQARKVPADEARRVVVERIRRMNEWVVGAAREHPGRLRTLVGADPNLMTPAEITAEIHTRVAAGASGGKQVPQALRMRPDDERLWPFYEACQALDVPAMMQSGGSHSFGSDPYARPRHYAAVFTSFPQLRLILAHLGAGFEDEIAALTREFPNCFTDLSSRLLPSPHHETLTPDQLVAHIRAIGVERVLFGTNYPDGDPAAYRRAFEALDLTDTERDAIAFGNSSAVFRR